RVLVIGVGAVQLAVAGDHAADLEDLPLVLVDDGAACTAGAPGDALSHEDPGGCSLSGGDEVPGAFAPDAIVAPGVGVELLDAAGKIGELMHHRVRPESR